MCDFFQEDQPCVHSVQVTAHTSVAISGAIGTWKGGGGGGGSNTTPSCFCRKRSKSFSFQMPWIITFPLDLQFFLWLCSLLRAKKNLQRSQLWTIVRLNRQLVTKFNLEQIHARVDQILNYFFVKLTSIVIALFSLLQSIFSQFDTFQIPKFQPTFDKLYYKSDKLRKIRI